MSTVEVRNTDPGKNAAVIRQEPSSSSSMPALDVASDDSTATGVLVKGAGTLLDCQNTAGTSKFKVTNAGNATVAGTLTVTGAVTATAGLTGGKSWLYQYLEPTGAKASSAGGRPFASATAATLSTGTVYAFAMPIEAGVSIANLTLISLTAEGTGTHAWVGIADSTGTVLAISVDKTGSAYFAANSAITTAITIDGSNPLVTSTTGLYYGFVCVAASGTMPTFAAAPAFVHAAVSTVPPIICGTALTSQTTPVAVASSLGTITPTAGHQIYAYAT